LDELHKFNEAFAVINIEFLGYERNIEKDFRRIL
jgi:hypothetical protein